MRRISVAGVGSGPGSDGPPGRADEARTADLIAIGSHHVFTFRSQIPSDFGTALRRNLGGSLRFGSLVISSACGCRWPVSSVAAGIHGGACAAGEAATGRWEPFEVGVEQR